MLQSKWENPSDYSVASSESPSALSPWLILHSKADKWLNDAQPEDFAKHLNPKFKEGKEKTLPRVTLDMSLAGEHFEVLTWVGKEKDKNKMVEKVMSFINTSSSEKSESESANLPSD